VTTALSLFVSSGNYYQQLTSPNAPGAMAPSFVVNLQVGFGDRMEGLIVGRPHPISVYDLQMELQQRFNIPVLEQNVSYNGMPLTQFPPDASLETLGIVNNSFISLWYRNTQAPPQQAPTNDYYPSRQQAPPAFYPDNPQAGRGNEGSYDMPFR
jgi:hypothetical protein